MELKNDLAVTGTLHSVDQYLNIKLENVTVVDQARFPQLVRSRAEVACLFVYVSVCLSVCVFGCACGAYLGRRGNNACFTCAFVL